MLDLLEVPQKRPGMISGRPFVAAKFGQSWIRIKDTEKTEKTQTNT